MLISNTVHIIKLNNFVFVCIYSIVILLYLEYVYIFCR